MRFGFCGDFEFERTLTYFFFKDKDKESIGLEWNNKLVLQRLGKLKNTFSIKEEKRGHTVQLPRFSVAQDYHVSQFLVQFVGCCQYPLHLHGKHALRVSDRAYGGFRLASSKLSYFLQLVVEVVR